MNSAKQSARPFVAQNGLGDIDGKIESLRGGGVPESPWVLTIPAHLPSSKAYPNENNATPFEPWEVDTMQYMTLQEGANDRQLLAVATGGWEEDVMSPAERQARSSSRSTPAANYQVKMSVTEYMEYKKTGIRPSPRPSTPSPATNSGPSDKGTEGIATSKEKEQKKERHETSNSAKVETREPSKGKDADHSSHGAPRSVPLLSADEHAKHGLPPRPPLPKEDTKKRSYDSDPLRPEKRKRTEDQISRSISSSSIPKIQSSKQSAGQSPPSKSKPAPTKAAEKRIKPEHSGHDRPKLPPLLSPLPADLQSDDEQPSISKTSIPKSNPLEQKAGTSSSIKKRQLGTQKPDHNSPHSASTSTKSTSNAPVAKDSHRESQAFKMPRMLSPGLPDLVEKELKRMQKRPDASRTVEGRHEIARQPNAPGVARKTTKPKVGHPPKPSGSGQKSRPPDKLIVKIPYKKRQAKAIERYLRTPSKPDIVFKRLEAERLANKSRPTITLESDSDVPLSTLNSKISVAKKRPSTEDLQQPASKRPKALATIDTSKASQSLLPAFKSPSLNPPLPTTSQKKLTATPKKSTEVLRSVTMRKVDSSEGHARTPQAMSTSTPASSEKPRVSADQRGSSNGATDAELRAEENKYSQCALNLKRQMDSLLKTKERVDPESIPIKDRALGLCVGIECLLAYMRSFKAVDRRLALTQGRVVDPGNWESWIGLWTYVERQCRAYNNNVLYALTTQLGAICREELARQYTEKACAEARQFPQTSPQLKVLYDKLASNSQILHNMWGQANRNRDLLNEILDLEMGRPLELGPWTSIPDVTTYALKVLIIYNSKEGAGWKRAIE